MSESRVRPLLEYKFQEQEQIVVRHKDQAPQTISAENYNQLFGVSLSHGVFYDRRYEDEIRALLAKCSALTYLYQDQNHQLKKFLDKPKSYFSICYLNEICGYALVANEDIPAATVVGTYSGLLAIEHPVLKGLLPLSERAYDMGLGDLSPIELDGVSYRLTLRAKKYSDLTRFAIHLPTRKELEELEQAGLLGSIKSKDVLTENITYPLAVYQGVPVRYYQTTKAIRKGELVGISYGNGYWQNRGRPCLLIRETGSADFRIAYFNKETNRYFLSKESVTTQEKKRPVESASSCSLPASHKPSFFVPPKEPKSLPPEVLKLFYTPKPPSYRAKPSSAQAHIDSSLARKRKLVVPHSQLPTQSSLFKARQDFNKLKGSDSNYEHRLMRNLKG